MKHTVDFDVDSKCYAPPIDAHGPTDKKCGNDAVSYVQLRNGVRRYICEAHVEQVERFADGDGSNPSDVDHPRVFECRSCHKLTPLELADSNMVCPECRE